LSDNAEIKGKPNLIIDTNNIKAKHALAIGRLNLAHIFYLQSKGIKKSDAIKLLLLSYFNVILYKIDDEKAKERLMERIFLEIGEIQ
ncbi:MAG: SufD family Fe-S cluster assembly protein, partial [Malacoplasma sp.]|nr:SufD family Fe-S cluster assembly protein [Malacoplasma sp.]